MQGYEVFDLDNEPTGEIRWTPNAERETPVGLGVHSEWKDCPNSDHEPYEVTKPSAFHAMRLYFDAIRRSGPNW